MKHSEDKTSPPKAAHEVELKAIRSVTRTLAPLDQGARDRVLAFVSAHFAQPRAEGVAT